MQIRLSRTEFKSAFPEEKIREDIKIVSPEYFEKNEGKRHCLGIVTQPVRGNDRRLTY
jgi:hypothetical protein